MAGWPGWRDGQDGGIAGIGREWREWRDGPGWPGWAGLGRDGGETQDTWEAQPGFQVILTVVQLLMMCSNYLPMKNDQYVISRGG